MEWLAQRQQAPPTFPLFPISFLSFSLVRFRMFFLVGIPRFFSGFLRVACLFLWRLFYAHLFLRSFTCHTAGDLNWFNGLSKPSTSRVLQHPIRHEYQTRPSSRALTPIFLMKIRAFLRCKRDEKHAILGCKSVDFEL